MNDYEMNKLREHWKRPGALRALLQTLPLTPEADANGFAYKKVVWMTGISFDEAEYTQVYYMLEELGAIVRDEIQGSPAEYVVCQRYGRDRPCVYCQHRNHQERMKATIRYHLAKPIEEY